MKRALLDIKYWLSLTDNVVTSVVNAKSDCTTIEKITKETFLPKFGKKFVCS